MRQIENNKQQSCKHSAKEPTVYNAGSLSNELLGTTTRNRVSKLDANKKELASKALATTPNNLLPNVKNEEYYRGFIDRWMMHDIARQIMLDPKINTDEIQMMRETQHLLGYADIPRVCKCMHFMLSKKEEDGKIQVRRDLDNQLAHYRGLMICGSVWACPICATKISEGRKNELVTACDNWTAMGENHSKVHVVYTIPHYHDQSLKYVQSSFMQARRELKKQKPLKRKKLGFKTYSEIVAEYGVSGTVTALEITYGQNGWHVHSHDLFFLDRDLTDKQIDQLKKEIAEAWLHALKKKVKLDIRCDENHVRKNAIEVERAKSPADYITKFGPDEYEKHKDILQKWGTTEELTKSHIKKSRREGKTPWDLLREILKNPEDKKLYLRNGHLWHEYTSVFKGKRQLFFSKNCRSMLGLELEKTDKELAEADDNPSELLGVLENSDWKKICKHKIKSKILILAVQMDWEKLCKYIDQLD